MFRHQRNGHKAGCRRGVRGQLSCITSLTSNGAMSADVPLNRSLTPSKCCACVSPSDGVAPFLPARQLWEAHASHSRQSGANRGGCKHESIIRRARRRYQRQPPEAGPAATAQSPLNNSPYRATALTCSPTQLLRGWCGRNNINFFQAR